MSLPGSELRHRRSTIQEIVQSLDGFDKTTEDIKGEKRTTGGLISITCFILTVALVFGELKTYLYGASEFEYKFAVDTAFDEHPELEVDMIVATPCTNLVAQLQGSDTSEQLFLLNNQFKKDATRFEFTPKEELYWKELKRSKQSDKSNAGIIFQSLDNLQYVSGRVEEGLKAEAEVKQREEALAIEREREKTKGGRDDMNDLFGGGAEILLIQNGVNVFHIIASNSDKDEGTACRISGRVRVNKVKGDSVVITPAKGVDNLLAHFDGLFGAGMHGKNRVDTTNLSHRIEKLNFGTSIRGLLTPLAGTEQISLEGADEYRYFLKIVPTRIFHHGVFGGSTMTYQYSVTKTHKKVSDRRGHIHPAIVIHYEFAALVIEVHQLHLSLFQLLIRLCSMVGGIFACSSIMNSVFTRAFCLAGFQRLTKTSSNNDDSIHRRIIET